MTETPHYLSSSRSNSAVRPISAYFRALLDVHVRPVQFFRGLDSRFISSSGALAFALVTHWIGSALEFVARSAFGDFISRKLDLFLRMSEKIGDGIESMERHSVFTEIRERFLHWIWGASGVLLDPFKTLFWIFLTTSLVYAGARILVSSERRVSFHSALCLVCFGMGPSIWLSVPYVGTIVSTLGVVVATTIGARELYAISTPRAFVIAVFPRLLTLIFLISCFLLLVGLLFGGALSLLSQIL